MLGYAKNLARAAFGKVGFELVPLNQRPLQNLMGLGKEPIKTVIDVGANFGQFAKYSHGFYPNATIHSFEPLPEPCRAIAEWAKSSGANVITHNCAVGSECGKTVIQHHRGFTASSSILPNVPENNSVEWHHQDVEELDVDVVTLDSVFPGGGAELQADILLKLDVQGFEDRVLTGAAELLPNCSLVIVEFCAEELYRGQAGFGDIYRSIEAAGLEYLGNLSQHHAEDGRVVFSDLVFSNKRAA